MAELKYLVVQVDSIMNGRNQCDPSDCRTGMGVLMAVSCDGYYASQADAQSVADYMAEERPEFSTHVVEIISTRTRKP